jgi:hypothetical protein
MKGNCKPTGRWWHSDFYPEIHLVATKLVPVVSTTHLVVRRLIGVHSLAHMLGTARTYPQVRVAQWHALLVLLCTTPAGWARYPSQILLRGTTQSSCMLHDGKLATKTSRRWQPPRVTSTTGLQLEHLVPLDVISQLKALVWFWIIAET